MFLVAKKASSLLCKTGKRFIGYLYLSSLKEREPYDRRQLPKLFTEVYDPKKDSLEAHLDTIEKYAFPQYK